MGQTVRYLPVVPRSRFRPLVAAGHAPQSDRPETIVRLVEQTARRAAETDAAGTAPREAGAPPEITGALRRSDGRSGRARRPSRR
jgi:hypothetical protein